MRPTLAIFICSWLWACSIQQAPESGSEPETAQLTVPDTVVTEPPPAASAESAASDTVQPTVAQTKPSNEDIRAMQERLTKAGFDVGPLDGVFGPKTKAALARLESACINLADLLANPPADKRRPVSDPAAAGVPGAAASKEHVRVLQVRLKEAGFDPGALDGIAGNKTRLALARVQSACAAKP